MRHSLERSLPGLVASLATATMMNAGAERKERGEGEQKGELRMDAKDNDGDSRS